METPKSPKIPNLIVIISLFLHFSISSALSRFSPIDNYLINCGFSGDITIDPDNRRFSGDSCGSESGFKLSAARSISISHDHPNPYFSPIYNTARVFKRPSNYKFQIKDKGTHMVRFHFNRLNSPNFDYSRVQFHVLVNGYLVLSNFTVQSIENPRIKEYMIWVDAEKLVISIIPSKKSKFGFVNAIEVISAPKDLIVDTAQYLNFDKIENFDGLTKFALETVHRVNVGGPKVTPFNDSLSRTWIPDDMFLKSDNVSNQIYFSGRMQYQIGGASREVAPDNVYNSARVITSLNSLIPNHNITWVFPVVPGYKYLVRTHFCDIASISLGLLYFNVYINGQLVYKDLDLTYITNELASPFYADFVVDGCMKSLVVSVGPSNMSIPHTADAILNGVEIMKMSNSMGSLDGEVSPVSVLKSWPRGNMGCLPPFLAVVCLLLFVVVFMHRRKISVKNSIAWSPLPVEIPELNAKVGKQQFSGKLDNF